MNLVIDIHNHTIASGHAYSTVLEYVAEAKKQGLKLLAITDHAPAMPNTVGAFYFQNFKIIPKQIDGIEIIMGVELNILDKTGAIDMDNSVLDGLRPIIASLHPPCYKFEREDMTEAEKSKEITETIIKIMDNPYIKILGHPGDPRFPFDIKKVVEKSIKTGTLLEINNSSLDPSNFRFGSIEPMMELLIECKRVGCPIVVGSDAHFATATGKFDETLDLLARVDFPEELVANTSVEYFWELYGYE